MNLNPDCTKDILQYILQILGDRKELISVDNIISHFKDKYTKETILAHINEIYVNNFVKSATYANSKIYSLETLSEKGHEFLKN